MDSAWSENMNAQRYRLLDRCVPTSLDSVPREFILHAEGSLRVVWAPFDHINRLARVAIVGITPGWQQTEIAYAAAREALDRQQDYGSACEVAKAQASFAGVMRRNLIRMLDDIGVNRMLEVDTTEALFASPHADLHTTSALRYPVFKSGENYTGYAPDPLRNAYLRSMTETLLVEELSAVAPALVIPLGKPACVRHAMGSRITGVLLLDGFPHPSGANGHRVRQFAEAQHRLSAVVTRAAESIVR